MTKHPDKVFTYNGRVISEDTLAAAEAVCAQHRLPTMDFPFQPSVHLMVALDSLLAERDRCAASSQR